MVTSLLDQSKVKGWKWQEEIHAWANFYHVLSPVGFKCQKQNQPNPLQQDSPVPSLPCEKTPQQPTPSLEPFQPNETPIPGPSQPSEPHEDVLTREPEPEVAPTQSMEEPFSCPTKPASIIIIDDLPIGSPLHSYPGDPPQRQAPLIPTMRLGRNLWTCD
ncbi:hypothetical protein O181_080581 [Austropuccinia psidii MF-1]|uniref:Uncharacterized protein n=1 Tax=Austropuccinia psidii MF-1 TaxID=1389203 RepID=A0A9Q3IF32_9BASI|nr:hypothetical protein [Austropuccinia psidii MF-1]